MLKKRPKSCIIGVSCDEETITCRRGALVPRYVTPKDYVNALQHHGAQVMLLPHGPHPETAAPLLLEKLDGLVIAGGVSDIPPAYYGQTNRPQLGPMLPERSAFERCLLQTALLQNMPVLGICGGMQLLNVVCGGTLYQDLSERIGTGIHEQPQQKHLPQHPVILKSNSKLARLYQATSIDVNSSHHQLVHTLGPNVEATGHADDGAIEAIEVIHHPYAIGVQWHPESLSDKHWQVYQGLIEAACGSQEN